MASCVGFEGFPRIDGVAFVRIDLNTSPQIDSKLALSWGFEGNYGMELEFLPLHGFEGGNAPKVADGFELSCG